MQWHPAASRRQFLTSVVAVGIGSVLPSTEKTLEPQRNSGAANVQIGRIDVHSHVTPPALIRALGAQRLGNVAGWTVEKHLDDMNDAGVSTAIVSIAPAGTPFADPAMAPRLTRESNEYAAQLTRDHPGRFGFFAALPLPNIEASLAEMAYALDTLKADGVALFTSYGDRWLGDPAFDPVFEELNRRQVVVYTHPATAACCGNLLPNISDGIIEWGTDTTRAITRIIFGGGAARYPKVGMIFSHAGGTMPFLVERLVNLAKTAQFAGQFPEGFLKVAARFYYDTAQTSNAPAMAALTNVVPMSQIVFGSDFPFRSAVEHVQGLQACGVFTADNLQAIGRQNVLALLPKFRT